MATEEVYSLPDSPLSSSSSGIIPQPEISPGVLSVEDLDVKMRDEPPILLDVPPPPPVIVQQQAQLPQQPQAFIDLTADDVSPQRHTFIDLTANEILEPLRRVRKPQSVLAPARNTRRQVQTRRAHAEFIEVEDDSMPLEDPDFA
jgi:hypothetical protein